MLSITALSNPKKNAEYYLNEEKHHDLPNLSLEKGNEDNYYLKENSDNRNTQWLGAIARHSGMEGQEINQTTLEKALQGHWGEETVHGKRDKHRPGFDITFSAPKSASLLALVGGDERLLNAHHQAVKFALSELEKDVAQVKGTDEQGKQTFENTGQMLFAAVHHKTSREDDPQLHTHALAANMTRDDEGKLRALASCLRQKDGVINGSSERLYASQKYYGMLYQSQYAKLAEQAGYTIRGTGNGQFEITAVPNNVLTLFSKRQQQIEEKAQELEFNSLATRDLIAKNTRKPKSYASGSSLHHKWQQEIKATDFDIHNVVAQAKAGGAMAKVQVTKGAHLHATLDRTVNHLVLYQSAFSLETVIEKAVSEFSIGGEGNAIDLKAAAEEKIAKGEWVSLDKKGQYTTQAMIETETRLLTATEGRSQHMRIHPNQTALDDLNLSKNSTQKIQNILASTKQFQVVNVFGPTESIASHLQHVGTQSQKRVHLVSSNSADRKRGEKNVIAQNHRVSDWVRNYFNSTQHHHLQAFLSGDTPFTNKDVILIDNAHKLSATDLLAITEQAQKSNTKMVFLNRTSARQGFKSHSAMTLYSKGNVKITQWVNHRWTSTHVQLHKQDALLIAKHYAALSDKSHTQVLATSQKEITTLTHEIRHTLQNQGQLARSEISVETQTPVSLNDAQREVVAHYRTGMTVKSWKDKQPSEWLISGLSRKSNTIDLMDKSTGEVKTFNVKSAVFKKLKPQLFESGTINLSVGESIVSLGRHFASGLEANTSYSVSQVKGDTLTLETPMGETLETTSKALRDSPIQYGYVQRASQLEPDKNHVMISGKSYVFTSTLIDEISQNGQALDIYTDNKVKTEQAMQKMEHRPSAITRVLESRATNDRFVTRHTAVGIQRDVCSALAERTVELPVIERAVSFAIHHISEREAGFTQKQLVEEAVRFAFEEAGQAVTKEEVAQLLNEKSDLLSAEYQDGTRWTTQAAIETEHTIIEALKKGQGQVIPYATPADTRRFLSEQTHLTQGQCDGVTLIATTEDRFIAIQGLAGTGKSTMLETGMSLVKQALSGGTTSPNQIIGLAPTHAAVSELKQKGIEAQTLESLLSDVRRGAIEPQQYSNALFLLDESSMVSNRQAKEFVDIVTRADAKAVFLGDKEQLQPLSAGKPFELAISQSALKVAFMTDIVRQQQAVLQGAVHNIIDKQPESSLDKLAQQATQEEGTHRSEHVVSTLNEDAKDQVKAQEEATQMLPGCVARDYLARTPETRNNTLIIAYTNIERDQIAYQIRTGLIKERTLGSENIGVLRIRQTGASKAELSTMLPYQKGLVVSTKTGNYATIASVDKENGVVMLRDPQTNQLSPFLPRHRSHQFTNVLAVSVQPISVGERILTRFTDKKRGIVANQTYTVITASNGLIEALNVEGQRLCLDPKSLSDGHWDYAYTKTADMAQGSTYLHVIAVVKGKGALTDIRRAGIDQTRASQHIRIYSDHPKAMLKQWINQHTNKASALETQQGKTPIIMQYFNDAPLPKENPKYHDINGEFDARCFSEHIKETLPKFTESLAMHLLGTPNKSQSNKHIMVFGQGRETTEIQLTGEFRGHFKDNVTGEQGTLINLLMSREAINYKAALYHADKLINDKDKCGLSENPAHDQLTQTLTDRTAKFIGYAKEYWNQSIPLKGTPAEILLNSKDFNTEGKINIRFHPAVYSSETQSTYPAMLTHIHDRKKRTQGIEITYLQSDGDLADLGVISRTLGCKSGNYTEFHHGKEANTSIITNTLYEAFNIQKATNGEFDIYIVNNPKDIVKMPDEELRQRVIIALESKETVSGYHFDKIKSALSNKVLSFIEGKDIQKEMKNAALNHHKDIVNDDVSGSDRKLPEERSKEVYRLKERFETLNHNPYELPQKGEIDKDFTLDRGR
ncbi:conjugative transfer relaxase/helicase TraI [Vibrio europaeus]|uniref:conjugative transfer relaxase/helicase TraI n=1 Tax=Vibrio europaeus TaxID=300876 RepID=UPI0018A74425|nr:conjugative transfer relaxase/helicase TraI [Vibrio europaeus]MDC5808794.1 conjugative transfer relaxase/helicase TraI [Vibrio europaeus]QPG38050.1 conjugative transfer relaxase/helicase TraI [Vibrio europaeus]